MQDMFKKKREGQANCFIFEFVVKTLVSTTKCLLHKLGSRLGGSLIMVTTHKMKDHK